MSFMSKWKSTSHTLQKPGLSLWYQLISRWQEVNKNNIQLIILTISSCLARLSIINHLDNKVICKNYINLSSGKLLP